eukprot:881178-Rhodomonas_salina.1
MIGPHLPKSIYQVGRHPNALALHTSLGVIHSASEHASALWHSSELNEHDTAICAHPPLMNSSSLVVAWCCFRTRKANELWQRYVDETFNHHAMAAMVSEHGSQVQSDPLFIDVALFFFHCFCLPISGLQ